MEKEAMKARYCFSTAGSNGGESVLCRWEKAYLVALLALMVGE